MSFLDLYADKSAAAVHSYKDFFPGRAQILDDISKRTHVDVVVAGGGIHGAMFARLSSLHGLSTVLLEREDYASGASGRSSKLAHGGLRYLEMLDFGQVFAGLRARNDLLEVAQHLARTQKFLVPVFSEQKWFGLKLRAGLWLYDLLQKDKTLRHAWLKADALPPPLRSIAGRSLRGACCYADGVMNDGRIVIENIIAARQEGALCLNHASIESLQTLADDSVLVGWRDRLGDKSYELRAGVLVNCAGAWVPYLGRLSPSALLKQVRYSQGAHLLFDKPWPHPALVLPLGARGSYYFVLPHFAGTLVGTTEREVLELSADPQPTQGEIEEILTRLQRDLPGSGLDRSTLHYCYAGVRTLIANRSEKTTRMLSRRANWIYAGGMLNLLGGKYATASLTVKEGFRMLHKLARLKMSITDLKGRKLPGAAFAQGDLDRLLDRAKERGAAAAPLERAAQRFGLRLRHFLEEEVCLQAIDGAFLRGELEMALDVEQAENLEDLMRRRLDLEYLPGNGLRHLPQILAILREKRGNLDIAKEEHNYRVRIAKLRELMGL